MLRTVIFDLDGTLIDSLGLILASYRHTMEIHLGRRMADELWVRGMGTPLDVQMRGFARNEQEAAAMVRTYEEHNLAHHDRLVEPYPGVRDAVEELRRRGLTLAIATSKRSKATRLGLRACDFPEEWFAGIVTANDVTRPKPDPQPVQMALERAGEDDPSRAIYIGDSVHDMRSGRAAGVLTAAVLWGPNSRKTLEVAEPDLWMEDPGMLRGLEVGSVPDRSPS